MMNQITRKQAEQLAGLVSQLRPGWDYHGVLKALERSAPKADALTLSIAVLAAAQQPSNETPAVLAFDGKHWERATLPGTMPPVPPAAPGKDTSADCPTHPNRKAWECKACEVREPRPENFHQLVEAAAEAARAERIPA